MTRSLLLAAGSLGFTAVLAGTFGAHGLSLDAEADGWWHTAALYHLVHAVAVLGLAAVAGRPGSSRMIPAAGWCFVVGVVVFSGSLYVMSLTGQRWLGAITPIGGLGMLAGWALVAAAAWRRTR